MEFYLRHTKIAQTIISNHDVDVQIHNHRLLDNYFLEFNEEENYELEVQSVERLWIKIP